MTTALSTLLASYLPTSFKEAMLSYAASVGVGATSQHPGAPTRTFIAYIAQALGIGFGVLGQQELTDISASQDGVLSAFAHGGLLAFASAVTPDPSVPKRGGTYPETGTGFLDMVADGIYNVQRSGMSGTTAQTNDSLVAECVAKLTPAGTLIAASGEDPYSYLATRAVSTYGVALSDPVTRIAVVYGASGGISLGLAYVYLATSTGVSLPGDVALVDAFLQSTACPWGVLLRCFAATAVPTTVALTVYVPGRYESTAAALVSSILTDYCNTAPLGGYKGLAGGNMGLARAAMRSAIFKAMPYVKDIESMTINGSAADLAMTATECSNPGAMTVTVVATVSS